MLLDTPLPDSEMARIAAEVGYSETAFAVQLDSTQKKWRVRYFSPETEVPFCGHATIALGAALGQHAGDGTYALTLNETSITVDAAQSDGGMTATLSSPPTYSQAAPPDMLTKALTLFGLSHQDLDPRLAPAHIQSPAFAPKGALQTGSHGLQSDRWAQLHAEP